MEAPTAHVQHEADARMMTMPEVAVRDAGTEVVFARHLSSATAASLENALQARSTASTTFSLASSVKPVGTRQILATMHLASPAFQTTMRQIQAVLPASTATILRVKVNKEKTSCTIASVNFLVVPVLLFSTLFFLILPFVAGLPLQVEDCRLCEEGVIITTRARHWLLDRANRRVQISFET